MTKIILIRHCNTEGNKSGFIQGRHNDTPLSEEGEVQLEKLSDRLKYESIDAVFCSDLGRTRKTADAIAKEHDIEVVASKNLRESDVGEWIKYPAKEAIKKWIEYYEEEKAKGIPREDIRSPGGENSWDHQKRIFQIINEIIAKHPNGTIIIVGHSGTNRVILGTCEGRDHDDFYSIPQDNACINVISHDENGGYRVEEINDTSHLE